MSFDAGRRVREVHVPSYGHEGYNPKCRACGTQVSRRWRETNRERALELRRTKPAPRKPRDPRKHAANLQVFYAVRRGELVKPDRCEQCGRPDEPNHAGHSRLHGHHEDYDKPLEVEWLCPFCHAQRHVRR